MCVKCQIAVFKIAVISFIVGPNAATAGIRISEPAAAWRGDALSSGMLRPTYPRPVSTGNASEPSSRMNRNDGGSLSTSQWQRGPFVSVQVNVDGNGQNIPGDAGNEPSIAVDPTNPDRIVIGWRQFDDIEKYYSLPGAGWAYSHDGGRQWMHPGKLADGHRSDPVLAAGPDGTFYYWNYPDWGRPLHRSYDGGVTWETTQTLSGGDKPWMTVDRTQGPGRGNVYVAWSPSQVQDEGFTRSTDGGLTFMKPVALGPRWGTLAVGVDGELFMTRNWGVARSWNAQYPDQTPTFEGAGSTWIRASLGNSDTEFGPNWGGLWGHVWVDIDRSEHSSRGNVYVLASVRGTESHNECGSPVSVKFVRSSDRGEHWTLPRRVNDYPPELLAFEWFGSLSVAPNGRIDAVWNDTRADPMARNSELYYSFSLDSGDTWSESVPVSPVFDHFLGMPPGQNKLGDYYHATSDDTGVNVAYAATFHGEQDIYFLRIDHTSDCNANGVGDLIEIAAGEIEDSDNNGRPDECDPDCNGNGVPDSGDLLNGTSQDCNDNGVPDACDIRDGRSGDCNGNLVPDECELDCNDNGICDDCDIRDGVSSDCNSNGIPDECEAPRGHLERVRLHLERHSASIASRVWSMADFRGGEQGESIPDDGSGFFFEGNVLNTDLSERIPYTGGAMVPSDDSFGSGSRYFTNRHPGLFVLGVENMRISTLEITGTARLQNPLSYQFTITEGDEEYTVYFRTPGSDDGVTYYFIIPGDGAGIVHDRGRGIGRLTGLAGVDRLYYGITAGASRQEANAEAIARQTLAHLTHSPDCNENGIPDDCDILGGEWPDRNGTGVPDACERIIFVDPRARGRNDGTSWEHAHVDLHAALAEAAAQRVPHCEVWVAKGFYRPAPPNGDPRMAFTLPGGVGLYGGFDGDEVCRTRERAAFDRTILSGDLNKDDEKGRYDDNSRSLLQMLDSTSPGVLDAFVFQDARSGDSTTNALRVRKSQLSISNCDFRRNQGARAALIEQGVVHMNGCVVANNVAIGAACVQLVSSFAEINECEFHGNIGSRSNGDILMAERSWVIVRSSRFQGNTTASAAMRALGGNVHVFECRFSDNEGRPILASPVFAVRDRFVMDRCAFLGNTMRGVVLDGCWSYLSNSVFSGNASEEDGGALAVRGSGSFPAPCFISNCTFVGNRSTGAFGAIVGPDSGGASLQVDNCIFWENASIHGLDHQIGGDPKRIIINYSNVQGATRIYCGAGNVAADPGFIDPVGPDGVPGTSDDDLRLRPDSPLVDAGWNEAASRALEEHGAAGRAKAPPPSDYAGAPRFVDAPFVLDRGRGRAPIVDMGAFEADGLCFQFARLESRCKANGKIRVLATTTLPQGKGIWALLDGDARRRMRIDKYGRGRATWRESESGTHKVCLEECIFNCVRFECP